MHPPALILCESPLMRIFENRNNEPRYQFESFFLRLTTVHDREKIKSWLGVAIVFIVFIVSVMRRAVAKNFLIAGAAFLALLLIYLIV